MPGPMDNILKHLTELAPLDWVTRGGWTAPGATVLDADIATISGASDKVIRVAGTPAWLLAIDFQAGHDTLAKLPDLLLYNSALYKRHGLLVRTLLVLLQPGADSPQLSGLYERGFPEEAFDVALRYRILRVWEVPVEQWLTASVGLLPLAPLGQVSENHLPAVIGAMKQRLKGEVSRNEAAELWSATYILMGLRFQPAVIESLLRGVITMKESVTYQAILEEGEARGLLKGKVEGKAEEARRMLLLFGRDQLGEPSTEVQAHLNTLVDVNQLEVLAKRLRQVSTWEELCGLPARRRSRRKRSSS
jgi:hypothetical protein